MKPLIDDTGEVRELTSEDLAQFKSAQEVLPEGLMAKLKKAGRPVSSNPKVSTTIRLDAEVIDFFKATGKGWQTRMNEVLREYVASN